MRKVKSWLVVSFVTASLALSFSCGAAQKSFKCEEDASDKAALSAPIPEAKKVFMIVFENTSAAAALSQPFFKKLTQAGAYLKDSHGITRPSQPNYIALTSGDYHGIDSNGNITLDERHLGDLIEEKGKTWKVYAEGYPGNCFLGDQAGAYAKKHVPFLSYSNVQESSERCSRVVASNELSKDIKNGTLADFSMYIPNNESNGHDTGIAFANKWFEKTFGPLLEDPAFMDGTLFIVTFDESAAGDDTNHIYTLYYGDLVQPGAESDACYTHYSTLRTVQEAMRLDTLGMNDQSSGPVQGIWKNGS